MKTDIEITEPGGQLVFKKGYTKEFVEQIIKKRKLNGLTVWSYFEQELSSFDFLGDYTFLEGLSVGAIHGADCGFLPKLKNLRQLTIASELRTPVDLSNQVELEKLNIQWSPGKVIGLEDCIKMKSLCIWDFKEKDFSLISPLTELVELSIKTSSIETVSGIEKCKYLKMLELGNCRRLKSVEGINSLPQLSALDIESCTKIEDYETLTDLSRLTKLTLTNCKDIKSIGFVKNFTALNSLYLLENTNVLDGDLYPTKDIEKVSYGNRRHYNLKMPKEKEVEHGVKEKNPNKTVRPNFVQAIKDFFR